MPFQQGNQANSTGSTAQASTGNRLDDAIRTFCESKGGDIIIGDIINHCRTFATGDEVRGRVKFLSDEGFLYSTTDDSHFAVC
jgi:hypothetical protein